MREYVIDSPLINEWNWEKNNELGLDPKKITLGSKKIAWWICEHGHEYDMVINRRKERHNNCPYCLGKRVLVGFNDLATVNPDLASEWNYKKNGELKPTMITGVCGKSVWWECQYGHEWQAKVSNRANGNGCPYCCGYYVLAGYNDLATTRPDLAAEWNYEKNGDLLPTQVSRGYGHNVWWKCAKAGHEWQASPNSRDNMDSGCPECSKGNRVSLQETIIYYYIKRYFKDAVQSYSDKTIGLTELDIYIPSLNVGIEYDGTKWHENIERDRKKDKICKDNYINLFRVREPNCPKYKSSCTFIFLSGRSREELCGVCKKILQDFGVENPIINLDLDLCEIKKIRGETYYKNNTK